MVFTVSSTAYVGIDGTMVIRRYCNGGMFAAHVVQTRIFFKYLSMSQFGAYSITIRLYKEVKLLWLTYKISVLDRTGFPTVTTP